MARKNIKSKAVRVRNEALYKAMQELRFSNAAQPHEDSRTARRRTRAAGKHAAIRDSFLATE